MREELSEAAGQGEAVVDVVADTAQTTGSRPVQLPRPGDGVSTVLAPAMDALPEIGQIKAPVSFSKATIGNSPSPEDRRPTAPSAAGAAMPPASSPAPAVTVSVPAVPAVRIPASSSRDRGVGGPIVTDRYAGLYEVVGSIAPSPFEDVHVVGGPSPTVPSPLPSPPGALDAITAAPGGGGSAALLWGLLAASVLLAPSFASKLRMNAGNCRPAPFVALLERPG